MPDTETGRSDLWRIAAFSGFLASAGLPLYVNLPQFAASLGLSLGAISALLLAIRVIDFVQDPLLGKLVDHMRGREGLLAATAIVGMSAGFAAVFALQPGLAGLAAALVVLFTAYSLGTILFYSVGVGLAGSKASDAHLRIGAWRETGALVGVLIAAVLPTLLTNLYPPLVAYRMFGLFLSGLGLLIWLLTRDLWRRATPVEREPLRLAPFLNAGGGRLLLLSLANSMPTAITSTLFLFYVDDRLKLPHLAGAFLVLFFLSAGVTAPFWSRLASRYGPVQVLPWAMGLAILAFAWAALLPEGAAIRFGAISAASGATLGADMVILPALFSATLARHDLPAGTAFGLWAFTGKVALALAAAAVLPALGRAGYVPGGVNTAAALGALTVAYAVLPCLLKVLAIGLVTTLPGKVAMT
jgi:Na+/melibiose symporter-like transporter